MKQGDWHDAKEQAHKLADEARDEYVRAMQPNRAQRAKLVQQTPALFDQMVKRYGVERVALWLKQEMMGENG